MALHKPRKPSKPREPKKILGTTTRNLICRDGEITREQLLKTAAIDGAYFDIETEIAWGWDEPEGVDTEVYEVIPKPHENPQYLQDMKDYARKLAVWQRKTEKYKEKLETWKKQQKEKAKIEQEATRLKELEELERLKAKYE